jgi:hypothetical protein
MPGLEQVYRRKDLHDRLVLENPTPADIQFLEDRLYEFNGAATGILDGRSLGVCPTSPREAMQVEDAI